MAHVHLVNGALLLARLPSAYTVPVAKCATGGMQSVQGWDGMGKPIV